MVSEKVCCINTKFILKELVKLTLRIKLKQIERFPHKPYIKEEPQNVTTLVHTDVSFDCIPLADLEPFMRWFYHNGSVENVHEGNLYNGTVIEVPNAKFLEIGGMPRCSGGFGGALS